MSKNWNNERKPFMAINALSHIFHSSIRDLGEAQGLNESYRNLLFHLSREDGVTQLDLSRMTHLKPPTISVTLTKMEAEGYIERKTDENDRRAVRVFLTEKGKAFESASRKLVKSLDARSLEGMSDEEVATLMELLDRIYFNLTGERPEDKCKRTAKRGGKSDQ